MIASHAQRTAPRRLAYRGRNAEVFLKRFFTPDCFVNLYAWLPGDSISGKLTLMLL